jgi:hypothetical protein
MLFYSGNLARHIIVFVAGELRIGRPFYIYKGQSNPSASNAVSNAFLAASPILTLAEPLRSGALLYAMADEEHARRALQWSLGRLTVSSLTSCDVNSCAPSELYT